MKMPNLSDLMVSVSDFKKQLSEIISKKKTKIIVKNNEPVSAIIPYDDYVEMNQNIEETQMLLKRVGQDVTLSNGVQIMVVVDMGDKKYGDDNIVIKTFIKMKTSGDYKLHHTLRLSSPREEETLTLEEYRKSF